MQRIGFKEWALVCQAFAGGEQSVIVRKGGIAEGADGFSFKHSEFFFFPTWFHEQLEKVRSTDVSIPEQPVGRIEIQCLAKVDCVRVVTSWAVAEALAPLHILRSEVVRERFDYDAAPGVHVALVRAFRLCPTWSFPDEKRFGGCRSWVNLPDPPAEVRSEPVLSDAEHEKRRSHFFAIVGDEDKK
jgi:hypothetical protein